jgi:hypothetical protein
MRKVIPSLLLLVALGTYHVPPARSMNLYGMLAECCKQGDDLCCAGQAFLDWM